MNSFLHQQYRETRMKFEKFSGRLQRSQASGEFQRLTTGKQHFLLKRVRRLWEKLRMLELKLKLTTAGATLACLMMVNGLQAQQFVPAPEQNPLAPSSISGVRPVLVDLDMDGDDDLLLTRGEYSTSFFRNTGSASAPVFQEVTGSDNPFEDLHQRMDFNLWSVMDFGDLDGDGDLDMMTRYGTEIINTGTNLSPYFVEQDPHPWFPYQGLLIDMDNDGDLDVLSGDSYGLVYFQNIGDASDFDIGDAPAPLTVPVQNWNTDINYIQQFAGFEDLDNDGDRDLIISVETFTDSNWDESISVLRNTGAVPNSEFTMLVDASHPYGELEADDGDFAFSDLDDDGDVDLLMQSYMSGMQISFLELTAEGLQENMELIPELYDGISLPMSYFAPRFADLDDDGDKDMFVWILEDYGDLTEYENTGSAQAPIFKVQPGKDWEFLPDTSFYQIPQFADIDQDGDLDVLSFIGGYFSENEVGWKLFAWLNTGSSANPSYHQIEIDDVPLSDYLYNPTLVDIDQDGDLDLFTLGIEYGNSDVTLAANFYESTGDDPLSFSRRDGAENPLDLISQSDFIPASYFSQLLFSDLDEDGDLDVAFTGYYGIYYLKNTGTAEMPSFVDRSDNSPFTGLEFRFTEYSTCSLVDLDGDGDDDLIMHEYYGMINEYFENTGPTGVKVPVAEEAGELLLYPNPAVDRLWISLDDQDITGMQYEVVDTGGRIVLKGELQGPGIDVSGLDPGYYILSISSDRGVITASFTR